MKIAIGSDHAGFDFKEKLKEDLALKGYEVFDCGTFSKESCHYPVYAKEVARKVSKKEAEFGIVICGTGEGVTIAANKVKGIRCGIGYNDEASELIRQHNNANMIAFGARYMFYEDVLRRAVLFLNTAFEGGRHATRVDMIED